MTAVSTGQKTVLVIEDDPGMRVLLEETLQAAGHEVLAAVNGKEGVLLFRAHPANLAKIRVACNSDDQR